MTDNKAKKIAPAVERSGSVSKRPKVKSESVRLTIPTPERLLEAGVHFGHLKRRWYPKMAPYIYTEKEGVHVFDLYKTREQLAEAAKFLQRVVSGGGKVLFVGTKKQAQEIVGREASRAGAFYLNKRWLGGLLTNFESIKKNIEKMENLAGKIAGKELAKYTKKEQLMVARELAKLEREIGGLKGMKELPQALVLASVKTEEIAAAEARQTGIPTVGIADTNADPSDVSYPIPGNDDASASIEIIIKTLADAVASAKARSV
uniref:Small ribosomal subunit protein uS2 n=1 Tax=candidate division WWE3 bacterium TaxID=2053526 RepID=A0A831Z2N9_UNCKA